MQIGDNTRKKTRLIYEIRYPAQAIILDKKGHLIEEFRKAFPEIKEWAVIQNTVNFLDKFEKPKREAVLSIKRASIIYEDSAEMDNVFEDAKKYFRIIYELCKEDSFIKLTRVGCRLICVHEGFENKKKIKSFKHAQQKIIEKFLVNPFPIDTGLPIKDFKITVNHENGFYYIGPVKKGEDWLKQAFKNPESNNMPAHGFGIDIDSFAKESDINSFEDLIEILAGVRDMTFGIEEKIVDVLRS